MAVDEITRIKLNLIVISLLSVMLILSLFGLSEKPARRLELFKNTEVIKHRLDSTVLSSGLLGTLRVDDQSRDKTSAEPAWVCAASLRPYHSPSGFRAPLFTYY